jgi:hypothetical protein
VFARALALRRTISGTGRIASRRVMPLVVLADRFARRHGGALKHLRRQAEHDTQGPVAACTDRDRGLTSRRNPGWMPGRDDPPAAGDDPVSVPSRIAGEASSWLTLSALPVPRRHYPRRPAGSLDGRQTPRGAVTHRPASGQPPRTPPAWQGAWSNAVSAETDQSGRDRTSPLARHLESWVMARSDPARPMAPTARTSPVADRGPDQDLEIVVQPQPITAAPVSTASRR